MTIPSAADIATLSDEHLSAALAHPDLSAEARPAVEAELSRRASAARKTVTAADATDRLSQLAAMYDAAKDAYESAKEDFEQVQAALKAELTSITREGAPFQRYELDLPALARPLALTYVERTSLDTKRIKAEHPEIAESYTKTSGSWTLARKK
jgi:hypothetical protein